MTPDESFAAALAQARVAGPSAARAGPRRGLPDRGSGVAGPHPGAAALSARPTIRRAPQRRRAAPAGHRPARPRLGAPGIRPQQRGRPGADPRVASARRGVGLRPPRAASGPPRRPGPAQTRWRARAAPAAAPGCREDELERPVWDPSTRVSRYDPRPAPTVRARLFCAHPGCHAEQDLTFPPTYALHAFVCGRCRQGFSAVPRRVPPRQLHPHRDGRAATPSASSRWAEAPRASSSRRPAPSRSTPRGETSWPSSTPRARCCAGSPISPAAVPSGCAEADPATWRPRSTDRTLSELEVLRRWRDEVLRRRSIGRAAVAWYYRASPSLVRWLQGRPRTQRWIRRGLDALVRRIG